MIKFLDLHKINSRFDNEFQNQLTQVLNSGQYILGDEVCKFENNFKFYCGTDYCIGTGNGLDALTMIFKAYIHLGILKPKDEVIVPANTYIASILAVINAGLTPVFVEPNLETYTIDPKKIEEKISKKTKAILAVHLYGQLAEMVELNINAQSNNLLLIEDAAQAHGAHMSINYAKGNFHNRMAGNLGDAAAFSFYPSKNLGALGDGGAVTTNDNTLADTILLLRNYGSAKKYYNQIVGINSRLDELQAAFLNVKLKHLDRDNIKRRLIASRYIHEIKNQKIELPKMEGKADHVFHLFVVQVSEREHFQNYLKERGVETGIHYPIPPHQQNALKNFKDLVLPITEEIHKNIVSLPISPVMEEKEVSQLIEILNAY